MNMIEYKTIKNDVEESIVEKRSKFIENIFYVTNMEEIEEKIQYINKIHRDAKHHCFAYRILEGNNIIERASDDGEPSGTAGMPLLTILNKNNLCNVLVIVTRYFGGILLGTGGLVRAYSTSAIKALEKVKLVEEIKGIRLKIEIEYRSLEKLQYYCKKSEIEIENVEYRENVFCIVAVKDKDEISIFTNLEKNPLGILNCEILGEKTLRKSKK